MANTVHNTLTVIGEPEDMQDFYEKSIKWENGKLMWWLSNTVPIPERLNNTKPGAYVSTKEIVNEREIVKAEKKGDFSIKPLSYNETTAGRAELIALYGVDNWLDWCCANWGVKRDCGEEVLPHNCSKTEFNIHFDSPWATPYQWLLKMQKMFPKLKFKLSSQSFMEFCYLLFTNQQGEIEVHEGKYVKGYTLTYTPKYDVEVWFEKLDYLIDKSKSKGSFLDKLRK